MSGKNPTVSVLMALRNNEQYVKLACLSILEQTFEDLELVIIDDGSTDASLEVIQLLQDSRLRIVSRENRGLVDTRNELLALARGPLVAWMDADDISLTDRLEKQVAEFSKQEDLVCLGGAVIEVDPVGRALRVIQHSDDPEIVSKELMSGGGLRFPTTMMRTSAARQVGGFRKPFACFEDLDLFLRLDEIGSSRNIPDVVLHYRQHPGSISRSMSADWRRVRETIVQLAEERRHGRRDAVDRGELCQISWSKAKFQLWRTHLEWATMAFDSGHHTTAWVHVRHCLLRRPWTRRAWRLAARLARSSRSNGDGPRPPATS